MRIDIKAIEGLLTACKTIVNTAKLQRSFPDGKETHFKVSSEVLNQVQGAIDEFEKKQKC